MSTPMHPLASDNRLLEPSELTNRRSPSFIPLPTRKSTLSSSPADNPLDAKGSTRSLPKGSRRPSLTQAFHTMTGSRFQRRRTDDIFSSESSQSQPYNPRKKNFWEPEHQHDYSFLSKEPLVPANKVEDEFEGSPRRGAYSLASQDSQSRQRGSFDFVETASRRFEPLPSQIPTPVGTPRRRVGQMCGPRQIRTSDNDQVAYPCPRGLTRTGSYFSHLDTSVSNLSVSSMSVYPTNEHVSVYDPRAFRPDSYDDTSDLPQLTSPFTDSDIAPLTTSTSMRSNYPMLDKKGLPSLPSMAHIKENIRSAIQPFRKESYAHLNQVQVEQMQKNAENADTVKKVEPEVLKEKKTKQDPTPYRSLMQPIHPPLPRNQTLGALVACGTANAGGRASSDMDRPGIGISGTSERANRDFGERGTYASTSSVPRASKSTITLPIKDSETSLRTAYKKISTPSLGFSRPGTRSPTDTSSTTLLPQSKVPKSGEQDDFCDDLEIDEHWYGSETESMSMPPVTDEETWVTVQGRDYMQIINPQPEAVWLGRFVALNDRFHNEDNFPNNATSAAVMVSSDEVTSRATLEAERARTKRVFLTLQAICGTEEAGASLRTFWTKYARQHGGPGPMSVLGSELPVRRRRSPEAGFGNPFIMGSVKEPKEAAKEGKGKEVDSGDVGGSSEKGVEGSTGGRGLFNRLRGLRRSFSGGTKGESE